MVKNILIILTLFSLAGCGTVPQTEYRDVIKPVLVCPPPPEIHRPKLKIFELTEIDKRDPGKVVQYYKATIIQLEAYISNLEKILDQYEKTSIEYDNLRQEIEIWRAQIKDAKEHIE